MPASFDPYEQWLGIPRPQQPPNHYRLLGIALFEPCFDAIQTAAEQNIVLLERHLHGQHDEAARRLIDEIAAARNCLLDAEQRVAYDRLLATPTAASTRPVPVPPPVESERLPAEPPSEETSGGTKLLPILVGAFVASFILVVGLFIWQSSTSRNSAQNPSPAVEPETFVPESEIQKSAPAQSGKAEPNDFAQPSNIEVAEQPANSQMSQATPSPQAMPADTTASTQPPQPETPNVSQPMESPAVTPTSPRPQASEKVTASGSGRAPIPSDEEQQSVRRQLAAVYDLEGSHSPEEEHKLAEQMIGMARQSAKRSAERFVLLRAVIDQAAEAGDATLMLDAVDEMGADFDIDVLEFKQMALTKFARHATNPEAAQSLFDSTMDAVDDAVAREDYAAALLLIGPAHAALRRQAGGTYRKEISDRRDEIEKLLEQKQRIEEARATLKSSPNDPGANLVLGRWLALVKKDWQQAVPYLVKGSDPQLQLVAKRELIANADDTGEQIAVGNAWWELAQGRSGEERPAFMRRAGDWYERAKANVASSIELARMEDRLQEIASLDRPDTGESGPRLRPGDKLPTFKWIDLTELIDPTGAGVSGRWQKKGHEIRVTASSHARVPLPVAVEGNYDLQFEFARTGGKDAIALVLPVGKSGCAAVFSGGGEKYSGFELLAKKPASDNPSTKKPTDLDNGRRYLVRVRVRLVGDVATLEATVNGVPYLRARGPQASLEVPRQWSISSGQRPALGANQSSVTFRNVQLQLVRGGSGTIVATDSSKR